MNKKLYINKDSIGNVSNKIQENEYILELPEVNLAENDRISNLRKELGIFEWNCESIINGLNIPNERDYILEACNNYKRIKNYHNKRAEMVKELMKMVNELREQNDLLEQQLLKIQ